MGSRKIEMLPLSFLTFCIELYAEHKNITSPAVYSLFTKTGLICCTGDHAAGRRPGTIEI